MSRCEQLAELLGLARETQARFCDLFPASVPHVSWDASTHKFDLLREDLLLLVANLDAELAAERQKPIPLES